MFVWAGKDSDDVIVICKIVSAEMRQLCIGRVASVLAELLCIGRKCHSYDSDRICHINTVLLIVN